MQAAQEALWRQAQQIKGGSPLSESDAYPRSPLDVTSDSNDSVDDAVPLPSKKRKPTYYMRKEEKVELEKELEELQQKIRELEATQHVSAKNQLDQSIALNAVLSTDIEVNNLALAGAQSMISAEMVSRFRNPLDHYIYLPEDMALRRHSLMTLKPLKVDTATRLIRERMRYLDIRQHHRHCETTVLKNGDFVMTLFDVTPFEGCTDVRYVFDQFIAFVTSQEISISENLGIISIRETDDCAESTASQCRLLSTIVPGLDIESNLAMFSKFVESPDGVTPTFGLGTVDYIDKDDLYDYQSSTRLRKDISACAYITSTQPDLSNEASGVEDQLPGTTMVRFATIRLHRPQFPLSKQMERLARASMEGWSEVMPKVLLERLGL